MNQITRMKKHNERVKRDKLECPHCSTSFMSRKQKAEHARLAHKKGEKPVARNQEKTA